MEFCPDFLEIDVEPADMSDYIYPGWDTDGMSEYERYKEWFRTQLEIDILMLDHPTEKETLEGIPDGFQYETE